MRASVKFLEQHNACEDQLELFKQFLGKRKYVLTTQRNLTLASKFGLDVAWLVPHVKGVFTYTTDGGTELWYKNGKLHRDNGPAIINTSETFGTLRAWYKNGKCHRAGAPAIIRDGSKHWYYNGKLHRPVGPAVEYTDGNKLWYINGVLVATLAISDGKKVYWNKHITKCTI